MPESRWRIRQFVIVTAVAVALAAPIAAHSQRSSEQVTPAPLSAKTWPARTNAIEEYLSTAPIVRTEAIGTGVTRPDRAYFAGGGPVDSMVWKALPPGMSRGYYESYKSEIAAYKIDKLLALDMVPPKVERQVEGKTGVAVMWVAPTKSFAEHGGVPRPPAAQAAAWNRQLVKAKMFQNLIGDIDPNLGNWLVDPSWNLILVDHSRALTDTPRLVHEMQSIDAPLWARISALTENDLSAAVGSLLGRRELRAILDRREKMQAQIDGLIRAKGEGRVFIRD
jgi:hypothetical protein